MKKTYKMFLALVLSVLGVGSVNAEMISLQEVPFCSWNGWGVDAQSTGSAECAWVIGEGSGLPYGDSNVINYADLSNYNKLVVVVSDGTPRFLFNRDIDEGQWNEDEEKSHLIDNTKGGWSSRYFTNDGNTYTVNLKLMVKEKGFAHLHSIKGANWANVTVESMEVEQTTKAPVGWTPIINNGDFESDDVSSFFVAEDAVNISGTKPAEISEGAGVNGSNGLLIESMAGATEDWATQLFIRANEALPEGTRWRFSMSVRADNAATVSVGAHAEPRDWKAGGFMPDFDVDTEWTTVTGEGTIDATLGAAGFQSIAFDLNKDRDNANVFYFDNINFEVFKLGTVAEFNNDVILLDFGFDTNMAELVKKSGKKRLMFPMDCASVKVNGTAVNLYSIEGFEDGRFYVFLEEMVNETDEVEVTFTNPTDEAYHLVYTSGVVAGEAVKDFTGIATNNADVEDNGGYPYDYETPSVMKADPEDGSFNLPNSIKEFKLYFDKEVDCAAVVATLNDAAMTVVPADGFATEITLVRAGDEDLPTDEYTIHVTKIYPKMRLDDTIFGDTTYVVNIGKPEIDPNDVEQTIIPIDYFNNCAAGSVPEGFLLYADGDEPEVRTPGGNYGSGARMMDFAAGGDFTKGLYMRTWYLEYGTTEGYEVNLEGGKTYTITFNSCRWAGAGQYMKFQVLNSQTEEEIFGEVVDNGITVNEKRDAVNGSTYTKIKFTPELTDTYILRWVVAKNAQGEPTENAWQNGVILANVSVKYIPNTAGLEWIQMLTKSLEDAEATISANTDPRYNGPDYDALVAAVTKYRAESESYTAPSLYQEASAALDAVTKAMKDHRQLCDNYDTQIKKSIDVQRQNEQPDGDPAKATKFVKTELFAQLVDMNAKYNASSEWVNEAVVTEEDPEPEPKWVLHYAYDVLKNNDSLTVAVKELTEIATTTSLLFTQGESKVASTGVMVLAERLRLGGETLKALGVAEDNALVVAINNTLSDDDELAEQVKAVIKASVYDSLRVGAEKLFPVIVDDETLEESTPTYDMTVFVKNPNVYKVLADVNFTDENVPAWIVPEGFNRPGLSSGWGATQAVDNLIAEDQMFQTWGGSYRVEQTVTDLPAGIYTIKMGFGERMQDDAGSNIAESFVYVKTSETPAVEVGFEEDRDLNFAGWAECPGIGQSFPYTNTAIENIVVADGVLTFGANAAQGSHTFFNDVKVIMTAPAAVDYAELYNEAKEYIETGVDAPKATVRGFELYDLNGRRMVAPRQGIYFIKKYMSDGSVVTLKVVKK